METRKENFGSRVSEIATEIGGQAELSRRTGISTVTIASYISGKSEPSRERLIALADVAKVSLLWLATGQGPKYAREARTEASPLAAVAPARAGAEPDEARVVFDWIVDANLAQLKTWWIEEYGDDNDYSALIFVQAIRQALPRFAAWQERLEERKRPEEFWGAENAARLNVNLRSRIMTCLNRILSLGKKDRDEAPLEQEDPQK